MKVHEHQAPTEMMGAFLLLGQFSLKLHCEAGARVTVGGVGGVVHIKSPPQLSQGKRLGNS